jgi:NADH dehydrogenase
VPPTDLHAVTGAYGYSGRYIARRLLEAGHEVITLTNRQPAADSFGGLVRRFPLAFDRPGDLARALGGVRVLYNTYWVRFNHRRFTLAQAVENSLRLFDAARRAGVERVVHVSITNPSETSPYEYFRGKAMVEAALRGSGLSYAILRPAVLFGAEDILINNIAWMLRRFPVFGLFGDGSYRLQPIYVGDLAELAVRAGAAWENQVIEAIGPETFTYRELVQTIGRIIGQPRPVVSLPPAVAYGVAAVFGRMLGDILVTREEVAALMDGLLYVRADPAGMTRLTDWAALRRDALGRRYASELALRRPGGKA